MTKAKKSMSESLAIGDAGEKFLQEVYPHPLVRYRGREFDFIRDDGARVELKTDQKSSTATGNLFIERWTVSERGKKPGSVWLAREVDVDIFLYMFSGDKVLFEFDDLPRLIHRIEACVRTGNLPLKVVQNKGFHGEGFAVPLPELRDLYVRYNCTDGRCVVEKK